MFYVYILKSEHHKQIYTGYTKNLKLRLSDHNAGRSPHTKKFKPWKLVTYIAFDRDTGTKIWRIFENWFWNSFLAKKIIVSYSEWEQLEVR